MLYGTDLTIKIAAHETVSILLLTLTVISELIKKWPLVGRVFIYY
jgi:hypothetical protein